MEESLDRLEERVNTAVALIARLKEERQASESRIGGLEEQMKDLSARNESLQKELAELRSGSVRRVDFEKKKRQIETRVEGLLQLFDGLEKAEEA